MAHNGYKPNQSKKLSGEPSGKGKNVNKGLSKYDKFMGGIAIWCSYYRANTHKFVEEYIGIKLKFFQIILLYMMNNMNYFMYIASRGRQILYRKVVFIKNLIQNIIWFLHLNIRVLCY